MTVTEDNITNFLDRLRVITRKVGVAAPLTPGFFRYQFSKYIQSTMNTRTKIQR